ncbi:hypothetical protein SK128_019459, partial [Halocaridina rubra]
RVSLLSSASGVFLVATSPLRATVFSKLSRAASSSWHTVKLWECFANNRTYPLDMAPLEKISNNIVKKADTREVETYFVSALQSGSVICMCDLNLKEINKGCKIVRERKHVYSIKRGIVLLWIV